MGDNLADALTALQAPAEKAEAERDEAREAMRGLVGALAEVEERARATAAAAYNRAAGVKMTELVDRGPTGSVVRLPETEVRAKIRTLATEAETTALAEIVKKAVDAERRKTAVVTSEECYRAREVKLMDAVLARLDQRKEGGALVR